MIKKINWGSEILGCNPTQTKYKIKLLVAWTKKPSLNRIKFAVHTFAISFLKKGIGVKYDEIFNLIILRKVIMHV